MKTLKLTEEYQGWSNSSTWSYAYLVGQERKIYEVLTAIRKQGKLVTAENVKYQAKLHNIKKDNWTRGKCNWQEIADTYNSETY